MDYPFYTPYNYAGNKPINKIDVDGMQENGGSPQQPNGPILQGMPSINYSDMLRAGKTSAQQTIETKTLNLPQSVLDSLLRHPPKPYDPGTIKAIEETKDWRIAHPELAARYDLNKAKKANPGMSSWIEINYWLGVVAEHGGAVVAAGPSIKGNNARSMPIQQRDLLEPAGKNVTTVDQAGKYKGGYILDEPAAPKIQNNPKPVPPIISIVNKDVKKNLNFDDAISDFVIYKIEIDGILYKFGKADNERITLSSGLPTRLHQQIRILSKEHPNSIVSGTIIDRLGTVTTEYAKDVENWYLQNYFDLFKIVPDGNKNSFTPKQ
jgi:hypothetical protein